MESELLLIDRSHHPQLIETEQYAGFPEEAVDHVNLSLIAISTTSFQISKSRKQLCHDWSQRYQHQ